MKMTEQEIKAAAEAIIKRRTRRETTPGDTDRYNKRVLIDQRMDELRVRRAIA